MALNWDKYDIEVRNDDSIKRNLVFFDLTQQTFNSLDGLYLCEICLLIDAILKDQLRKESAVEIEKINISHKYNPSRLLNVCCMKSNNIRLRFIA